MSKPCLQDLRATLSGRLSPEDINEIVSMVEARARDRRQKNPLDNHEDAILRGADDMAREMEVAASVERRNFLINLRARERLLARVDEYERPNKGMAAILVGERGKLGLSTDARGKAMQSKYLGGFLADLEKGRVLEKFQEAQKGARHDGAMNRLIARELWEQRDGGKPGITGSIEARKIAEVIRKWQRVAIERENRAGAVIRELPGYIVRQRHDAIKMGARRFEGALRGARERLTPAMRAQREKEAMDRWIGFILPRLDPERTFGDADPREYLTATYHALVSGVHLKHQGAGSGGDSLTAFRGPRNLAKRLSTERKLHFKSADDWYDYHREYGSGDLMEAVIDGLQHAAKNTALMEDFGTNPRAMFDTVMERLRNKHKTEPEKLKGIGPNFQVLKWYFKELDGTTRTPGSLTGARIANTFRAAHTMGMLGSATLSAMADVPVMGAAARLHGMPVIRGYHTALQDLVRYRGNEEGRLIAELIGVGFDGFLGSVVSRFDAADGLPGVTSRMLHTFFKLNLLTPWTDGHKTGMGMMLSHELAAFKGKRLDALPKAMRRELGHYDIGRTEWDLLRGTTMREANEMEFLVPEQVADIDGVALREYRDNLLLTDNPRAKLPAPDSAADRRSLARTRDELESRLQAYFVESADSGVPTPGARERAFMRMGTQPGTPAGEVLRFMMQFKAFPITVISRVLPRVTRNGDASERVVSTASLIAMMTLFGYFGLTAQDLSRGRTPRDPREPKTWIAAFAKGGGAGIYGDFLTANYTFGRGPIDRLMGPGPGTANEIGKLYGAAVGGDDFGAHAARIAWGLVPGNNLFYTKGALDYLVVHRFQEMVNPGYLRRMEQKMEKERHQTYLINPSQVIR